MPKPLRGDIFLVMHPREAIDRALEKASTEHGLQSYYRDCVRPLLTMPETQWPSCCAGNCEPCNGTLVAVAKRTLELLELG